MNTYIQAEKEVRLLKKKKSCKSWRWWSSGEFMHCDEEARNLLTQLFLAEINYLYSEPCYSSDDAKGGNDINEGDNIISFLHHWCHLLSFYVSALNLHAFVQGWSKRQTRSPNAEKHQDFDPGVMTNYLMFLRLRKDLHWGNWWCRPLESHIQGEYGFEYRWHTRRLSCSQLFPHLEGARLSCSRLTQLTALRLQT